MRRFFFAFAAIIVMMMIACTKEDLSQDIVDDESHAVPVAAVKSGRLRFNSTYEFEQTIDFLRTHDGYKIDIKRFCDATRSDSEEDLPPEDPGADEFRSLRDYLIEQGLREFSDEELAEIIEEELEYEPEDSIIADEYLMSVLNEDREVQIDDKIYCYVNDGIVIYDAEQSDEFDVDEYLETIDADALQHGETVTGEIADFIRIEYPEESETEENTIEDEEGNIIPEEEYEEGNPEEGSEETRSGYTPNVYSLYASDGSLQLSNNVNIPKGDIVSRTYVNGKYNGWFDKIFDNVFGMNHSIYNKFDSNHRMKLRLLAMDYVIYTSTAMTIRMQKKKFGVWWRTKAQSMKFGWSAIECSYKIDHYKLEERTKMPDGVTPKYEQLPTAMVKDFPFGNTKIVFFRIPWPKYSFTTGSLNKLFSVGVNAIKRTIKSWSVHPDNTQYSVCKIGIYTYDEKTKKIYVVYPQGEDSTTDSGRDVVRWNKKWFSGNVVASFKLNIGTDDWNLRPKSLLPSTKIDINRARVYGAVKYNNVWKACVIETK